MELIVVVLLVLLVFGGYGYRVGPGPVYWGGGGLGFVALIVVLWLLIGHGGIRL